MDLKRVKKIAFGLALALLFLSLQALALDTKDLWKLGRKARKA